jgi:hypothetical protein
MHAPPPPLSCLAPLCCCPAQYLRPLYRALYRSGPEGKAVALDTFKAASHTYFPVAAKMVEADLHLRPAAAATP